MVGFHENETQREQNLLSHLIASVTTSHEKENIFANTMRYWSILSTIISITKKKKIYKKHLVLLIFVYLRRSFGYNRNCTRLSLSSKHKQITDRFNKTRIE